MQRGTEPCLTDICALRVSPTLSERTDTTRHGSKKYSRVEELEGNEGPLVVFASEQPVATPSPIGRPISEWGVKTERRVALRPVFDDIPP